ncbi:MAG: hypothetical protein JSU90_00495, partial [Nitrospiraceae bacterium]
LGECSGNAGQETCTSGVWGNDTCDPLAGAAAEACDNLDNDCDGSTDEGLQYELYTVIDPSETGSITPDCSGGCIFGCRDSAVLNAIEDNGYPFMTWAGCDSSSDDICYVTMDDNRLATAEFESCRYPARVLEEASQAVLSYHSLLQDAMSSASAGAVIESRAYSFTEDITFDYHAPRTLRAGYNCSYSTGTGMTTIIGNVTISSGSFTVESGTLEIAPP